MARTWGRAHPLHVVRAGLTPAAAPSWTPGQGWNIWEWPAPGQGWLRLCGYLPPRGTSACHSSQDMPDLCSSWSRRGEKQARPFCLQQVGHLHGAIFGVALHSWGASTPGAKQEQGAVPRAMLSAPHTNTHEPCTWRPVPVGVHQAVGAGPRPWASPDCDNKPRLRTHHCPHSAEEAQGPA